MAYGWTFFWAFIDKTFGFGFATEPGKAWLAGGSPTYGFLKFATRGPLIEFYQGLAGSQLVAWLFMMGLLGIGLALLLGVAVRPAAVSGIAMYLLMYSALLPPKNNPFLDDHLIGALVLAGIVLAAPGAWLGLGRWWSNISLVRRLPWLR